MTEPRGPSNAYQTFELIAPKTTHTRRATCAEVGCLAYAHGWVTRIDLSTDLGARQYRYIRDHAGRSYTLENMTPDSPRPMVALHFPAGQQCFAEHRVALGREPLYVVRAGWRRAPGRPLGEHRTHARGADWVDDMQETIGRTSDELRKG